MRRTTTLLATLAALSQLTGCTSFQAKEAGRGIAGGLFEGVLEGALDGYVQGDKERRTYYACFPPCVSTSDRNPRRAARELEEKAQRKREREVLHYKKEADAIIDAIDEAEWQSGQLQPESATTDYEQQEEERLLQHDEMLEHQAEFDEFMRKLEAAEQQSDDPPSITTTSQ